MIMGPSSPISKVTNYNLFAKPTIHKHSRIAMANAHRRNDVIASRDCGEKKAAKEEIGHRKQSREPSTRSIFIANPFFALLLRHSSAMHDVVGCPQKV